MVDRVPSHDANRADNRAAAGRMALQWAAAHEAAAAIGELAGIAPEYRTPEVCNFPAIMRDTGGWRYRLAVQGVDDLAAIIEPGLVALVALHGSGAPARPAALALWEEFRTARAGLLALAPRREPELSGLS